MNASRLSRDGPLLEVRHEDVIHGEAIVPQRGTGIVQVCPAEFRQTDIGPAGEALVLVQFDSLSGMRISWLKLRLEDEKANIQHVRSPVEFGVLGKSDAG